MVFVLAMVLYPDVQKRAQAEMDSVVGRDRLPTFEDRESLPYLEAVLRELLRWQPIVPLGDFRQQVISPLLNTILQECHMLPRVKMYSMDTTSQKVGWFCPMNK